jgi:hypothetical protein
MAEFYRLKPVGTEIKATCKLMMAGNCSDLNYSVGTESGGLTTTLFKDCEPVLTLKGYGKVLCTYKQDHTYAYLVP